MILAGQRFFRVMDLRPDNPVLDTLVTVHFSDAPSIKEPVRLHPEMLIAADATIRLADASRAVTKKKVEAAPDSGTLSDPEVP